MAVEPADEQHQRLPAEEGEEREERKEGRQVAQRSAPVQQLGRAHVADREERHRDDAKVPNVVLNVGRVRQNLRVFVSFSIKDSFLSAHSAAFHRIEDEDGDEDDETGAGGVLERAEGGVQRDAALADQRHHAADVGLCVRRSSIKSQT